MWLRRNKKHKIQKETREIFKNLKKDLNGNEDKERDSLKSDVDLRAEIHKANIEITKTAEEQKLFLRDELVIAVKHIIWFQICFFNIIILLIVLAVTTKSSFFRELEPDVSIQLFEFLKYYIGATIVELLGMLGFILHYVFSNFRVKEWLLSDSPLSRKETNKEEQVKNEEEREKIRRNKKIIRKEQGRVE